MDGNNMNQAPQNNKAVVSLILGIVSLVCIFTGYGTVLGIIAGIVGLILGMQAQKETPSGMAMAGIVLSIIGLALCAIFLVACVACVGLFGAMAL